MTLNQIKSIISRDICSEMAPHLQEIQNALLKELKACDLHIHHQVWGMFTQAMKLTKDIYHVVDNTSCNADIPASELL